MCWCGTLKYTLSLSPNLSVSIPIHLFFFLYLFASFPCLSVSAFSMFPLFPCIPHSQLSFLQLFLLLYFVLFNIFYLFPVSWIAPSPYPFAALSSPFFLSVLYLHLFLLLPISLQTYRKWHQMNDGLIICMMMMMMMTMKCFWHLGSIYIILYL